jgi:hypothetical protein
MRYILLLPFFFINVTYAGELTVFDVRKPITLSDKEVVQKDFYIDSGSEAGLQKGMIVTVVRKVPLYDTYQSRSAGDLKVEVAKVRIIHVQQGLSVARFVASVPRADIPILEDDFIMIGDRLDMSTATRDKRSAMNDEGTEGSGSAPAAAPVPTPSTAPVAPAAAAPPASPPPSAADKKASPPVSEQKPEAAPVAPPPAKITSQKIELSAPADPGIQPIDGPSVQ